jgi:uncharacterized protein YecE (DUF72 family)
LTEFLIGAGGWAYFQVPGLRSLEAYARAFDFVEVNSTFYEIPSIQLVESWRRRVPRDFEFSVRCHKSVTHRYKMEPVEEAFEAFESMKSICRVLDSRFLVLETPSALDFTDEKIESVRNFFEGVNQKEIRVVWELRRKRGEPVPPDLVAVMRDHNIIHCVDFSKEEPAIESDIVYSRVFGKGEHNIYQFTDKEIKEVDNNVARRNPDLAAVSYHNVRMYKDAARHKVYKETGEFPSVTGSEGEQSLRKVLMEDARFPITKTELLKDQGWKVIDLTEDTRVHARALLGKLPNKQYENIEEIMESLPKT